MVARLAPGATLARASAEVRTVAARIRADHPVAADDEEVSRATVVPYVDVLVGDTRRTLWMLLGAVGMVLVIASANVANLLLARASRQAGEGSLRKALGATRGRIVAQQLVASLMLAVAGGLGGLALGTGLLAVLEPLVVEHLPRVRSLELDGVVLAFTLGATVLAAVLAGLIPAIRSASREAAEGLRSETTAAGRHRGNVLNRTLVAAELALAVILVAGAALAVQSFRGLAGTDPGFDAGGVLALRVAPPPARYAARDAQRAYQAQVLERIRAVPGVARAGSIHLLPLTRGNWAFPYLAEGQVPTAGEPLPTANSRVVSPGYFETMRIPLLRGRDFNAGDDAGPDVGIINRTFAEELWPGEDPIGREIKLFGSDPFTVVGVVGDTRQMSLDREPFPEMYVPMTDLPLASTVYMVRAAPGTELASLMPGLQDAVWSVDEDVPIPLLRPLTGIVGESVAAERLTASLLTGFAALALVLGLIGVYGVMAYVMGGRAREFAIRAALGATRGEVERKALADSLVPLGAGLLLGTLGALAAGRILASMLHDVEPADPATLGGVVVLLAGTTLLASWLPARRAARAEAVDVLRAE